MKHVLTINETIRGLRLALASPLTPAHLKPSLRRYMKQLQAQSQGTADKRDKKRRKRPAGRLKDLLRL
jgi:hypothetical protein